MPLLTPPVEYGRALALPPSVFPENGAPRATSRCFVQASSLSQWLQQKDVLPSVAVSTARPDAIEALADLFVFREYSKIYAFLERHPFLLGLLTEAYEQIQLRFGMGSQVALQLIRDPEYPSDEELFGLIQTNVSVPEAMSRLSALDAGWWLEASRMAECKLNFEVEFV